MPKKICPYCQTENDLGFKHCCHCGRTFPSSTLMVPGQTLQGSEQLQDSTRNVDHSVGRSIPLDNLFKERDKVVIGRMSEADVYLPHPNVSRLHAEIDKTRGGLIVRDLHSINGVFLNGTRIQEQAPINKKDAIGIGPFLFVVADNKLVILDNSQSLRLQARSLEKYVRDPKGQARKILDNISLVVEPGEFVSLLGPSGSGKSTLMDCLNGRRPATGGVVLANGENFYRHYKSFRQTLGYVPQKDIVHTQLTVYSALYYTARLRLPLDMDHDELHTRINEVLEQMELVPHQHTLIHNLSGGQIKRVSLGAELLAHPCLLYIDEATSGLDAGTESRMMQLFRDLANEGKSIICITHNVDNVDLCNLILVLMRGKLVYYGPPEEARTYFDVSRISEVYDRLAQNEPEHWEKLFRESDLYKVFVERRLSATERMQEWKTQQDEKDSGVSAVFTPLINAAVSSIREQRLPRLPLTNQFWVLTQRNLELLWRDRGALRLMMLQAPVVALFILLGFAGRPYDQKVLAPRRMQDNEKLALKTFNDIVEQAYKKHQKKIQAIDPDKKVEELVNLLKQTEHTQGPVVPHKFIVNPRYTYILLFVCVLVVLWFGCNNAAKEIVKEDAIYSRERAVNLGFIPYLSSKFAVLSVVTIVQVTIFALCVFGSLEFLRWQFGWSAPYVQYRLPYPALFGVLAVLSVTGVALGLLLSSCVRSAEKANTLLPYVLIPQIILGGGVLIIKDGLLFWLSAFLSPVYWAFRAVRAGETELPIDVPVRMNYSDNIWIAIGALLAQMVVLLIMTAIFVRRKDVKQQ